MRLTKRQLKRIIREEYSRLKRRGLIKENVMEGDPSYIRGMLMDAGFEEDVDHIMMEIEEAAESAAEGQDDIAWEMCRDELRAWGIPENIINMVASYIGSASVSPYDDESDMMDW